MEKHYDQIEYAFDEWQNGIDSYSEAKEAKVKIEVRLKRMKLFEQKQHRQYVIKKLLKK